MPIRLAEARIYGDLKYHYKKFYQYYSQIIPEHRYKFHWKYNAMTFNHLANYVKASFGYACFVCGHDDRRQLHCHHIIPKSVEPERFWDVDNLVCLCIRCHSDVHGWTV